MNITSGGGEATEDRNNAGQADTAAPGEEEVQRLQVLPEYVRRFLLVPDQPGQDAKPLRALSAAEYSMMALQPDEKRWEGLRGTAELLMIVSSLLMPTVLEFRPPSSSYSQRRENGSSSGNAAVALAAANIGTGPGGAGGAGVAVGARSDAMSF